MSQISFPELLKQFHATQEKTHRHLASLGEGWIFNEGYAPSAAALYIAKAQGCHVEDFDGNRYLDTGLAAGGAILGHASEVVTTQVQAQLARGSVHTAPNMLAHQFGELLHAALPWFGGFAFCNSGAEATMRAIRLARAYTGRSKIAIFSGGWHGAHDMVLVEEDPAGDPHHPTAMFKSGGTPKSLKELLVFLPYNDPAAFDIIRAHRDDLAMVMIEPSQGSNPRDDVAGFLRELRRITEENGILLGFDEVITGFRLALGGAQELYGIQADLATYGKIIGGGLPVGLVGGRTEIMRCIREGSAAEPKPVYMGGTFSANPLTMVAGMAVLRHLTDNRATLYAKLSHLGDHLKTSINAACVEHGIPARMLGVGSMLRLMFTDFPVRSRRQRDDHESDADIQKYFFLSMLLSGVHVGANRINFLSTVHRREEVDEVARAYIGTLRSFNESGLLGERG